MNEPVEGSVRDASAENTPMRLFVALYPPESALGEVQAALATLHCDDRMVRWVGRERLHLTLAFLGSVASSRLPDLRSGLERVAATHPPMRLSLAAAGAFPRAKRARVLWVGVDGETERLARLAGAVTEAAESTGIEPKAKRRALTAHLTLARCREPSDVQYLVDELEGFRGTSWTGGEMRLMRSYLGPEPRHETVSVWPLEGAG